MQIAVNASSELLHNDFGRLRAHAERAADDGFAGWWLAQVGLVDALTSFTTLADVGPGMEFGQRSSRPSNGTPPLWPARP